MNETTTSTASQPLRNAISDRLQQPARITVSNYQFKSLCEFAFNTCVGCAHGCRFCYVPGVATNKQADLLAPFGVDDPDAEWGDYVLVREWDEDVFLSSLRTAENRLPDKLKPEGHRAVMLATTTDPYQVIPNPDPKLAQTLTKDHYEIVQRGLELIRDRSTLRVRILTRSPLAKRHFDLFKSFGNRLVFGMSLPTLNDKLAKVFEPHAPGVGKRLETLQAAKDAGLNVYVAMAPTYPECDEADLHATLTAIAKLDPLTVFHEPINIRAENVERIRKHGEELGFTLNLAPFETPDAWRQYSWDQFQLVEKIAADVGLSHRLHLWPDKDMPSKKYLQSLADPTGFVDWLTKWWTRISEWPE